MKSIVSPDWSKVGSTSNADFYEMRPDVLVCVPHQDATDDAGSARESLAIQKKHWTSVGRRGAVVIWMDPVVAQDSGARGVYTNETGGVPTTCYAIVGESFFAMATASVFTGLAKPGIDTQIFRSLDEALPWIEEMNKARGGAI
jgi:hypothetical protein